MLEEDNLKSLKRSKLFKRLSDKEIEQVYCYTLPIEKEYDKNETIINQGEAVSQIGIIKRGTVISRKYHANGDAQILRIYKQGEAVSLDTVGSANLTSPVTLVSQTDSSIVFFPSKKLFEIDELNPVIKEKIMLNNSEILSNELVRMMYKIDVLSKRTLQERILTYLGIMMEKRGKNTFDISMNQEQLAQYLCANRSVLSKELNQMRKCGLIDYKKNRYTLYQHASSPNKANE